jgi:hypothetical protein
MSSLLTISQVCRRVPGKAGASISPSTVTRWILLGCPARDGIRVRLAATRAGSRWLIDPTDLDAFFARLKGDIDPSPRTASAPATDPARRAKAAIQTLIDQGA